MKTKDLGENCAVNCVSVQQSLGYVSRKFSLRSKRYKKLGARDDVEEPYSLYSKSQEKNVRPTSQSKDFDEFVDKRLSDAREWSKFNAAALDEDDKVDVRKEAKSARSRRHAICEEMERYILNDAGVSLRGYREVLVTRRLLYEMHLL